MFDEWKRAWREAVENFRRELNGTGGDVGDVRVRARRELAAAADQLARLESDLARTRTELDADLEAERICRRREALARRIGDEETARIAAEFASRHAERAAVLKQKAEALTAERTLRARELDTMRAAVDEIAEHVGPAPEQPPGVESEPPPGVAPAEETVGGSPNGSRRNQARDEVFRELDQRARERAAEARLEELKRRMQ